MSRDIYIYIYPIMIILFPEEDRYVNVAHYRWGESRIRLYY